MLTATSRDERLACAAEAAGLKRTRKGLFGAGSGKADAAMDISPLGALTLTRPWIAENERDLLMTHARWRGPVKLLRQQEAVVQRIELFLGPTIEDDDEGALDDFERRRRQEFLTDVLNGVPAWVDGLEQLQGWEPPPARLVCDWLNAAGHEAAIDSEDNLRLALKRRGCDGQIRVERQPGRMRFSMLLGEWSKLAEAPERAMLALADEANSRTRLVRIAWIEAEENGRRCEAQVDLSGLPYAEPLDDAAGTAWKETVRMTVDGLELALRRLGLELNALADEKNRELVEAFAKGERGA
jgi:hypothetical protein